MVDLTNCIHRYRTFNSIVIGFVFLLFILNVQAATYNLTSGSYPPCNTNWNVSGTTYTCNGNGRVTLASGDVLTANTTITISANDGFVLSNNTIGSATNRINLVANYGAIQSGNTNTVYGNITGSSSNITLINTTVVGAISTGGAINLTGGSVSGAVNSSSNTVTTTNTTIGGAVTANGNVSLTGGSVAGLVTSVGNTITTNGTSLSGGAQAQSGMSITGGTIAGNFVMTSFNAATFSGVTMTSGSISGASTVTVQSGSVLGSGSNSITISSNSGPINVNNSTVYGSLTAPNYSTVNITNGGAVYGTCSPGSTPANACNNAATQVNHYRITHSGTGITCEPSLITIRAYNSLGNLVNPPNGTVINLSTLPATGTWSPSNSFTFNGATDTATLYLRQTTPATLNINISGAQAESASYDPSITFVGSGLRFYGNSSFAAISTQVAGSVNSDFILRAIRTDNNTGACVAQTTGMRAVNLAYECRNPVSCISGQELRLNNVLVTGNANNASISYQSVTLNFNNAGVASIPFSYTDVGLIRLHAQLSLTGTAPNPTITLAGISDEFVVKPHTLAVSAVTNSTNVANPGTTASGSGFVAAGEKFKVSIQSRNASGSLTPNFGKEVLPQINNVVLSASSLVYPAGADLTGLTITGVFSATTPIGTFINSDIQWNQVGSIVISPVLSNYLGGGGVSNYVNSGTVGRFYPYRYVLANTDTVNTCNINSSVVPTEQFHYMGKIFNIETLDTEKMGLKFTLTAQDTSGNAVTNYDPDYKGDGSTTTNDVYGVASVDFAMFTPSQNLNTRLVNSAGSQITPGSWVKGVININQPEAQFGRLVAPDGPYSNVKLGVAVKDCLDKRALLNANLTMDTTNSCGALDNNAYQLATFDARYGRLRLDDAFGPESADLPVNFATEYWLTNRFVKNFNDNCTTIRRSAINYPAGNILTPSNLTVALTVKPGNTIGQYLSSATTATEIGFTSGDANHRFLAPTSAGQGSFDINVDVTSYPWLRFDWNQDGNYSDATLPPARYTFGSYRGHDRVIYWRERFQ